MTFFYDGHRCMHEALHFKSTSFDRPDEYEVYFETKLSKLKEISININMYTIYGLWCHLDLLQEEFPNITHLNFVVDTTSFKSLEYFHDENLFALPNDLNFTTTGSEEIINSRRKSSMPMEHYMNNINYLCNNITYHNETIDVYENPEGDYYQWFLSLNKYYKDFTEEKYLQIVKENFIGDKL